MKKIVCFGEILWDLLPDKELPGGAPMNVAYHLHKLGENPVLVTRIGIDERGQKLLHILNAQGINTGYIQTDNDTPTGIVHAEANEHGEMKYDIVKPAAWDYIQPDVTTEQLAKDAGYFVFGSLSTRAKASKETLFRFLEMAKSKVLDINLRAPFFNQRIVGELLHKTDVVKMNLAELELITGWFAEYKNNEDRMQLIQDRFNIRSVIVTMGGDGAVVNFQGKYYTHPGFKVTVADTIGSGDAFLAGFLNKILNGEAPEHVLTFASALGALVTSKSGGWPDYTIGEIEKIIQPTSTIS